MYELYVLGAIIEISPNVISSDVLIDKVKKKPKIFELIHYPESGKTYRVFSHRNKKVVSVHRTLCDIEKEQLSTKCTRMQKMINPKKKPILPCHFCNKHKPRIDVQMKGTLGGGMSICSKKIIQQVFLEDLGWY